MDLLNQPSLLTTEEEIIKKVIAGEVSCFEILLRRTNPYLYKIGRSYGFNHQDTEDLMQETHISAYQNLGKFQQRSTYKTWVTRIMINHCNQRHQKSSFKNEKPEEKSFNERSIPMFSTNNVYTDTGKKILNKELSYIIENAVNHIPLEYRTVFCLRELNDLSVAETATALGITEVNVKVRLNRAKTMLKKQIEKMYLPEDIYEFNLVYCDKISERVMNKIREVETKSR